MDLVRQWVEARLDGSIALEPAGHPDGEAEVWRVTDDHRAIAYLKIHRVRDKWQRERRLLQRLEARECPVRVPPLLAAEVGHRTLLLGALPGRPASELEPTMAQRCSLHEQAGRFRRFLDSLPVEDADPLPLSEALGRRHRAWSERARGHLDDDLLDRVERALDPSVLVGIPRRWCHRDFTESNWIVEPTATTPRLGVIDFGQARPDAWLVDVVKLWSGPWRDEPTLADAFWNGYGRALRDREPAALRQLVLLHGLATATWGDRHGHTELSSHGRAVLEHALPPATAGRSA